MTDAIRLSAQVDERHVLIAQVPNSVPPGPVTVIIVPLPQEDDSATSWMAGIAHEWADELSDSRQDIYTLADGEPAGATG